MLFKIKKIISLKSVFKLVHQGPAFDVFIMDLFFSQFSGCFLSSCFVAGTELDTGWDAEPELDARSHW